VIKLSSYIAGRFHHRGDYKVFIPNSINQNWLIDDPEVLMISAEAHHALGKLDAFSTLLPDIDRYEKLIVAKEATESSRIEGTKTEVEDIYIPENELRDSKRLDQEEVKNYIAALSLARHELEKLPISTRLLRLVHQRLMLGVRGADKTPGEFRRSQVWIGGRTPQTATIVPPPAEELNGLLGDLEYFIHNPLIKLPPLIRIAITHYQFAAIHPFLDGNGRTGRMLIILQLLDYGLLQHPTLYLSEFIDKHRSLYYDGLSNVSYNNNLRQWLLFFLDGIKVSAEKSATVLQQALLLREQLSESIKRNYTQHSVPETILSFLFSRPIFDAEVLIKELELPKTSVNRHLKKFVDLEIIQEMTGMQRNRIFAFRPYLNLFR